MTWAARLVPLSTVTLYRALPLLAALLPVSNKPLSNLSQAQSFPFLLAPNTNNSTSLIPNLPTALTQADIPIHDHAPAPRGHSPAAQNIPHHRRLPRHRPRVLPAAAGRQPARHRHGAQGHRVVAAVGPDGHAQRREPEHPGVRRRGRGQRGPVRGGSRGGDGQVEEAVGGGDGGGEGDGGGGHERGHRCLYC